MITLISAQDLKGGIGTENNELLFHLPKDLRYFKSVTTGKIVVMGRKTWDSLPKRPLEKRKNYVLTRDESFSHVGAKAIHSIEEIVELGKKHDIYVIGGGEVYEQLLPYADRMMITHVHYSHPLAEVFYPDYDTKEWTPLPFTKHEADEEHPHSFTFATYERKK